jgi:hypothetical protein
MISRVTIVFEKANKASQNRATVISSIFNQLTSCDISVMEIDLFRKEDDSQFLIFIDIDNYLDYAINSLDLCVIFTNNLNDTDDSILSGSYESQCKLIADKSYFIEKADKIDLYSKEILNFGVVDLDLNIILQFNSFFNLLINKVNLPARRSKSDVILTIDCEEQHIYFDNKSGKCTNISSDPKILDDTRFNVLMNKTLEHISNFDFKTILMIAGDELRDDSVDGFGNSILDPETNISCLKSLSSKRNIMIANHSYGHEIWLRNSKNTSSLNFFDKLIYFFKCKPTFKTFCQLTITLLKWKNIVQLLNLNYFIKSVRRSPTLSDGENFVLMNKLLDDNEIRYVNLFRAPGFRLSNSILDFLKENGFHDSSIRLDISKILYPSLPFELFQLDNGFVERTNVIEFPCIWIDEFVRFQNFSHIKTLIEYFSTSRETSNSVLTLITHLKITGSNFKHFHYNSWNPTKGLSIPPSKDNLIRLFSEIDSIFTNFIFEDSIIKNVEN